MAKKDSGKKFGLPLTLLLILLAVGFLWLWTRYDDLNIDLLSYIENGEGLTLESKFTPQSIMEDHRKELIGNSDKKTFLEPIQKYYPYLMLEVKYTENKKSREGRLIWDLTDGEIVLNTETWETSHGFKDCITCHANRNDFKILQALSRHKGSASIDELQNDLHVDRELLDPWLESAKEKHLIVQKNNLLQLHFENPKLLVIPQTQIKQILVSKPIQNNQKTKKNFSHRQVINMAKVAFGEDFTVRSEKEFFLPVYTIGVSNPDGSVYLSDWNAINGSNIKIK